MHIKLNPDIIGKEFPADYSGTKFKIVDEDENYIYIILIREGVDGPKMPMSKNAVYRHAKLFGVTL